MKYNQLVSSIQSNIKSVIRAEGINAHRNNFKIKETKQFIPPCKSASRRRCQTPTGLPRTRTRLAIRALSSLPAAPASAGDGSYLWLNIRK